MQSSRMERDWRGAGFSLIELMLVLSLLAMMAVTVGKSFLDSSRAFTSMAKLMHGTSRAQAIADRLVTEIITGRFISLNPPSPVKSNALEFEKIVGFDGLAPLYGNPIHIETVPLESNPSDGIDNNGNGLVDEEALRIWEDLPPYGPTPTLLVDVPVTIATKVAKDGLKFTREGSILLIDLTLQEHVQDGVAPKSINVLSGVKMRN